MSLFLTKHLKIHLININWLTADDGEAKVALYSAILILISVFYGAKQLQNQRRDSLFANEYINQPNFLFEQFCDEKLLKDSGEPGCCCLKGQHCKNECTDEHWFNLKQIGNLPAINLKISMFHKNDSNDICCYNKIITIKTLTKGDRFQYKLTPFSFKNFLFDKNRNNSFIVLLSYKSLHSNLKYKRAYELDYPPEKNDIDEGLWGARIRFYKTTLTDITDFHTLSLKDIILANLKFYLFKLNNLL